MRIGIAVAAALFSAFPAAAASVSREEAGKAQSAMLAHVEAAVDAYAQSIGMVGYIGYCRVKMDAFEEDRPKNGLIPWVNYNDIDRPTLDSTITARQAFETAYLKVCLAETKNILRAAAGR